MAHPASRTKILLLITTAAVAVGALAVWGSGTFRKEQLVRRKKKARAATVKALLQTLLQRRPQAVAAHVHREGMRKQVGDSPLPYRVLLDMEQLEQNIKVMAETCARRGLLQVRLHAASLRFPALLQHCAARLREHLHAANAARGRAADNVLVTIGLSTTSAADTAVWVAWLRQQSTGSVAPRLFSSVLQLQPSRSAAEDRSFAASAAAAAADDVMCLLAVDSSRGLDAAVRTLQEEQVCAALAGKRLSLIARIEVTFSVWEQTLLYSLLQLVRRAGEGEAAVRHVRSPADVELLRAQVQRYNGEVKRAGLEGKQPRVALEGVLFGEQEGEHLCGAHGHQAERACSRDILAAMEQSKMASLWAYLRNGNPISKCIRRWRRSEVTLRHRRLLEWYYLKNLSWCGAAMESFFISDPHCVDEVLEETGVGEGRSSANISPSLQPEVHLGAAQLLGGVDYYVEGMRRDVGPALFVVSTSTGRAAETEHKWEELFPTILIPSEALFSADNANEVHQGRSVLYTPLSTELCLQHCDTLYGVGAEDGHIRRMTAK